MNLTERRERFRRILTGDKCYHPGSVYDPMSARMAEEVGYEFGMFAGSTASLVVSVAPALCRFSSTPTTAMATPSTSLAP